MYVRNLQRLLAWARTPPEPLKMVRKTKEEARLTHEELLDAAEICFHEHGLARTTLAMIGARAGYTRGAVYWHFRNKGELLEAVINRVKLPFMQELERLVDGARTNPIRDLRRVTQQSLADLQSSPRLRHILGIIMLRCDSGDDTRQVLDMRREGFSQVILRITNALRRAGELGQLRAGVDIDAAAAIVHMIMLGSIHGYLLAHDSIDLQRTGISALDIVLRAFVIDGVLD